MHCGMYLGSRRTKQATNIKGPDQAIASAKKPGSLKAFVFALTASKRGRHVYCVYGGYFMNLKRFEVISLWKNIN